MRRHRGWRWPIAGLLLGMPGVAEAHNALLGMGEFVNGFAHPLSTPAQVLVLLGLALLLGQRAPLRLRLPLAIFAPVSGLALAFTATGLVKVEPPVVLAVVALAAGILVATAAPLNAWVKATIFGLAAVALGLDSIADAAVTPWAVVRTLFGTWIGLTVWMVDAAYYVSLLPRRKWAEIGVRVIGSWITAISFLVLAFALKR